MFLEFQRSGLEAFPYEHKRKAAVQLVDEVADLIAGPVGLTGANQAVVFEDLSQRCLHGSRE
jgi:hypothetical protein